MSQPEREFVRFPAAGTWGCSHAVFVPHAARIEDRDLRALLREGILAVAPGPLRDEGLAMLMGGRLDFDVEEGLGGDLTLNRLRIRNPDRRAELAKQGRVVHVTAEGRLDALFAPLWITLAGTCRIARSAGGLVFDAELERVLQQSLQAAAMPASPPLVLTDHFVVCSASDEKGRAFMHTMGLTRLGIPDLELPDLPDDTVRGMAAVFNGLAWRLMELVLATPAEDPRSLRVEAEMTLDRAWIESSRGRPPLLLSTGDGDAPPVRLAFRRGADGSAKLIVAPGRNWRVGRKRWARAVVTHAGYPPSPIGELTCGHEMGTGGVPRH